MAPPPGPRPRRRGRRPGDRGPPRFGPGFSRRARRPWPWPRSGRRRSAARPRARPDPSAAAPSAPTQRRPVGVPAPAEDMAEGQRHRVLPGRRPGPTHRQRREEARGAMTMAEPEDLRLRSRATAARIVVAQLGEGRRGGVSSRSRTQVGSLAGSPDHRSVGVLSERLRLRLGVATPQEQARQGAARSTRSGSPPKRHRAATPTRRARRRARCGQRGEHNVAVARRAAQPLGNGHERGHPRLGQRCGSYATARSPAGRPLRSRRRSPGCRAGSPATSGREPGRRWPPSRGRTRGRPPAAVPPRRARVPEAAGSMSTTAVRIEPAHTVATTQSVPHLVHAATASRATAMKAKASGVLTSNRPRPGNRRFRTTAVAGSPRSSRPRATMSSTTKQAASTPATARRRRTAGRERNLPSARCARRSSTTPATTRPARGTRTATRSSQPLPWARRSVGAVTAAQSWTGNPRAGRAAARPPVADHG